MHKTDKIFLAITMKAIFMIIPFFVQVTGFVHLSKLHFKCKRAVCRVCLSISLHLPAIHSPCLSPRLSTHSSTYLLSALSLIALRVMEEHRVPLKSEVPRLLRSVQQRWTHLVLKGRHFSAAQWPPGAAALYPVRAPYHLLSHTQTHTQKVIHLWMMKGGRWDYLTFNMRVNMYLVHIWSQSACCWPAASVSVVSLLAGSPWRPPPDTGEDRVDGSDPLASESSLGCFFK